MTTDTKKLRELLAGATPGLWGLIDWQDGYGENLTTICVRTPEILWPGQSSIWPDGMECHQVANTDDGNNPLPDAALIVAAVNALPELLDEVERLREAIKRQAAAVRNLQTSEDSQINVLRKQSQQAHIAVSTLDSERDMNAILTEENERLRAELAEVREAAKCTEQCGRVVMEMLDEHGPSIVPHLIDTDDNVGQRLRNSLDRLARALKGETR
jgi:hypothetical protein